MGNKNTIGTGSVGPVTGEIVTTIMTLIGEPSIPGAKSFPEVFSCGNISIQWDRWALIQGDTLPAYQDLLKNNPDLVREIISFDFNTRVEATRIENRIPEVLVRLLVGFTGTKEPPEKVKRVSDRLAKVDER